MNNTAERIIGKGKTLIETVNLEEFGPWIKKIEWNFSMWHIGYYVGLAISIGISLYIIITHNAPPQTTVLYVIIGFVLTMGLAVLHEYIHYFMYKSKGAENVSIMRFPKSAYALAVSDRFETTAEHLKWIALMPFFIISPLCILGILFTGLKLQIVFSSALLFHTTICKDDFRILHYFTRPGRQIKMTTDLKSRTTYIYE